MSATTTLEPGLHLDLPEVEYHRHPALSASGMKKLLDAPAKFDHERKHGQAPRATFDFGHLAHNLVLGKGEEYVTVQAVAPDGARVDAIDYRLKSAREHRDEIRAEGKVPVLAHEIETAEAMAAEIRKHPIAGRLLAPGEGEPEVSAFWCHETGQMLRARFDYLPPKRDGRRLIVPDYKTAASAKPSKWIKSAGDYGYDLQADQYEEACRALDLGEDPALVFVIQEKEPPFLVSVVQLTTDDMRLARRRREHAIRLFIECSATDHWPGYGDEVANPSLPPYFTYAAEEALA